LKDSNEDPRHQESQTGTDVSVRYEIKWMRLVTQLPQFISEKNMIQELNSIL